MGIIITSIIFRFQTFRLQINYSVKLRDGLAGTYCDIVDFAGPRVCKGNYTNFFKKKFEDISPFCGATDTPVFKANVDPFLAFFVACMQWIPQIHLC